MSETTTATTVTPDDALTGARERLSEATNAHQAAREASEHARAALAELEAAADRGEAVKTAVYTEAKAELGLKSRRTSALAAQVAQAQQAVDAAQEAVDRANLRSLAQAVPDVSKALTKAEKAVQEYLTALRAQDDAVQEVYRIAGGLPNLPGGSDGDGWPCYDARLDHRIGFVRIDGVPIKRPQITHEAERLAETIVRLAREHRS